jgi:hypothetical protein
MSFSTDQQCGRPVKYGRPSGPCTGVSSRSKSGWLAAAMVISLAVHSPKVAADITEGGLSPRDWYNEGTEKFRLGKLHDAESSLQNAVATQDERVQGAALYNLGHVRFREGLADLKAASDGRGAHASGRRAGDNTDAAIRTADEALAGTDLQAIVDAYLHGRGVRKELKAATEAVKRAIESNGAVLAKWGRSSGDFKSAFELRPADGDANVNAQVVDQYIARLVDIQRMLMMMQQGLQGKGHQLKQKLAALKGRMPGDMGKGGVTGDEEDDGGDEDKRPKGPQPGQEEGPSKDGKVVNLTVEEAEGLLEMLRLDSDRKLPMGDGQPAPPRDRKRRDW